MKKTITNQYNGESGNVLFLIFIAVALFAALSYAVTRSTRTSSDSGNSTNNRILAAAIVQYPATIRTALLRMMIDGTPADELSFDPPENFDDLNNLVASVFHPNGGNATYQTSSPEIMVSDSQGVWHFNNQIEIENIGTQSPNDIAGNDIVSFLPGIKRSVCEKINSDSGITGTLPVSSVDLSAHYSADMHEGYTPPTAEMILGSNTNTDQLKGQPFGCFMNSTGEYVYYHVLVEK